MLSGFAHSLGNTGCITQDVDPLQGERFLGPFKVQF